MYKLVVIEDEAIVRKNIIKKVEWEKYGFEVVGEGENGREALEVIENTNPNVVITDIEMPFLNGIELSSIIREKYPNIKIVFLTGFNEFKYAQKAIELDVIEYILKPVSAESMADILAKIKNKLDEEVSQKKNIEALREHYLRSIPVMRADFLSTLISRKQQNEEILSKADYYNINLKGNIFAVSAISIDKNTVDEEKFSDEDYELIRFAVLNTAEEILNKYSLGFAFSHDNYIVLISFSLENSREVFLNKLFNALDEIRSNINDYLKFTITIGIGSICTEVSNISESFKSALSALDYRFTIGNNRLIYIEDLEPQNFNKIIFDETKEYTLISSIKFGDEKDIYAAIEKLFEELIDTKASFSDYQIYLLEILASIVKIAKDLSLDIQSIFGANYNLFVEMFKFDTISDVREWFEKICIKLMKGISKRRKNSGSVLVEKAKEYILQNYPDNELSLNKVSSFLHISPNYFGAIFKSETGETFGNFLLKVRMESARDLICAAKMKNFEVAEKVGYADEHYFSYSFKKYFKISPNEFRKSLNKY